MIVEHTNINPNKAAHIGHLRNAVLGDVLVATLRALGHPVEVQNYIDDTGVQVADVVVGCVDLRGLTRRAGGGHPRALRLLVLGPLQRGRPLVRGGSRPARRCGARPCTSSSAARARARRWAGWWRRRVLVRHLATMRRLGIGYDLLTHEGDILALDFFHLAFERLKAVGVVRLESEGKNAGCWVMPLAHAEEFAGLEEPDKVIVRSDGTVTYVGKDIAYQLWKFGLLGKDFQYRRWEEEAGVGDHRPRRRRPTTRRSAAPTASSTSSTSARATCRRSSAPASRRWATPSRRSARCTSPTRWWR